MQDHNCHHNHESNNGFLLGVIVGAVLTLLMVTKKGRKILRMLTDEGIEKISDLERILEQKIQEVEQQEVAHPEDEIIGDEYIHDRPVPAIVTAPMTNETAPAHHTTQIHKHEEKKEVEHTSSPIEAKKQPNEVILESRPRHVRRFFKGVPKKS